MSQHLKIFALIVFLLASCYAEDGVETDTSTIGKIVPMPEKHPVVKEHAIQELIKKYEQRATKIAKSDYEGKSIVTSEEVAEVVALLYDITDLMNHPSNVYTFIKVKGIDRVIVPSLPTSHEEVKSQILVLIKLLFEIAPATTNSEISINVIDTLIDIFENEDNLGLKAHALDVLYLWLPGNPRVQARVMKIAGLEPFYDQITKLDSSVIHTLLDLFNTIISEHLKVRSGDNTPRTDAERKRLEKYVRIGLLEKISTPIVCNGLLNIYKSTWTYGLNDDNIVISVFELIKNTQHLCVQKFKNKTEAIELFENLMKYVADLKAKDEYNELAKFNATETELILQNYIEDLNIAPEKEEL